MPPNQVFAAFVATFGCRQACAAQRRCSTLRLIDTTGMPKGWDIDDAVGEGWSPRQIAAWAGSLVREVEVVFDALRSAA
jgi:hypothetical protein